jgi:hypothetical protein
LLPSRPMPKTTTRRARSKPAPRVARAGKAPPSLAGRLRSVTGPMTFREIGGLTKTHPENARRYMQGMAVSLEFVRTSAGPSTSAPTGSSKAAGR